MISRTNSGSKVTRIGGDSFKVIVQQTTEKPTDREVARSLSSSDESVPGTEPVSRSSASSDETINASSDKLSEVSVALVQVPPQPQATVTTGNAQVPNLLLPPTAVPTQSGTDSGVGWCTTARKYTLVAAAVGAVATELIIVVPAFVDRFDEPETEAIKTHLPLSATLAALGGAALFGAAGRLYYWFFHQGE